jgi:hypothetical protein
MGNAKARARASQRVTSGKQSQRMQAMSPGTKEKIHTSYRQPQVAADGKKLSFSDAYADKDTEWKATQRARAALPRSQAKRAKVMQNLAGDHESKLFAEACCGGDPKELAALRLLGKNIHALATQHTHGESMRNDVRHLRRVLAAISCSEVTRSDRLMRETSKITGMNHRVLMQGIIFREKLLQNDVKALCAQTVRFLD